MRIYKIKSYCKINLSLKVLKKLSNGYHSISSLVTFCDPFDEILITNIKSPKDIIIFSGRFNFGIDRKINSITKVLTLLRKKKLIKNQSFKINIKKNIPYGSGLGGGTSNAASLLNFFNKRLRLKLKEKQLINIAKKIGSDVPVSLEKKNTFITGKKNQMLRTSNKFKMNLLIVYPNIVCSSKKIYKNCSINDTSKYKPYFNAKYKKKLIKYLKNEENDLEKTVIKIYPKVGKIISLIKLQKGCLFSRITGSGSACIGIFSNKRNTVFAQKLIKSKYPKYWCVVSKTI